MFSAWGKNVFKSVDFTGQDGISRPFFMLVAAGAGL